MSRWAISAVCGLVLAKAACAGLVLSRAHELQADRDAARIAGAAAMASSLWRLEGLTRGYPSGSGPSCFARAAEWPEPPCDIANRLTAAIRTPPEPEVAAVWTERGLIRATLHDETHPALLDRVRPLGMTADDLRKIGFPMAAQPSAAEALLGELVPTIERAALREMAQGQCRLLARPSSPGRVGSPAQCGDHRSGSDERRFNCRCSFAVGKRAKR